MQRKMTQVSSLMVSKIMAGALIAVIALHAMSPQAEAQRRGVGRGRGRVRGALVSQRLLRRRNFGAFNRLLLANQFFGVNPLFFGGGVLDPFGFGGGGFFNRFGGFGGFGGSGHGFGFGFGGFPGFGGFSGFGFGASSPIANQAVAAATGLGVQQQLPQQGTQQNF